MKYSKLIKAIRVELSEATVADKEKAYVRAKACLLHVQILLANVLRPCYARPDQKIMTRAWEIVNKLSKN